MMKARVDSRVFDAGLSHLRSHVLQLASPQRCISLFALYSIFQGILCDPSVNDVFSIVSATGQQAK